MTQESPAPESVAGGAPPPGEGIQGLTVEDGTPGGTTTAAVTPAGSERRDRRAERRSFLKELPFLVLLGFGIVVLVKAFLLQAFYIPSGSMEKTLLINDRVLVFRQSYLFNGPRRGDVIVFRNWDDTGADTPSPSVLTYVGRSLKDGIGLGSRGRGEDLIKRVIGLPGETVEVKGSIAYVDGRKLKEPYVWVDGPDMQANFGPLVVPKGHYFVMGDHRNNSSDSRAHFPIDRDAIVGKAFVRIWPPSRIGGLGRS